MPLKATSTGSGLTAYIQSWGLLKYLYDGGARYTGTDYGLMAMTFNHGSDLTGKDADKAPHEQEKNSVRNKYRKCAKAASPGFYVVLGLGSVPLLQGGV